MVPPSDETPRSLGDGVTGSDVGPPESSSPQCIGEGVTSGDFGSELEELGGLDRSLISQPMLISTIGVLEGDEVARAIGSRDPAG